MCLTEDVKKQSDQYKFIIEHIHYFSVNDLDDTRENP